MWIRSPSYCWPLWWTLIDGYGNSHEVEFNKYLIMPVLTQGCHFIAFSAMVFGSCSFKISFNNAFQVTLNDIANQVISMLQ